MMSACSYKQVHLKQKEKTKVFEIPPKTEIVPLEGKTLKSYPQHITLNYRRPPEILSGRKRI